MKLKIFLTLFVSSLFSLIPQNIIGCGGFVDPYDYYTSFFNQYSASKIQYKPFFYTNALFLFDTEEPENPADKIINEWVAFTKNKASKKDAYNFVMRFNRKDLSNLYYHLEKNAALKIPDSVAKNTMTQFFIQDKNLEALGYLMYAKQAEPYVTIDYHSWEPASNDSLKMDKLIKNGLQLYKAAKTPLFRLKYGYQITRLAHYSTNYKDAIKYYDELIAGNNEKSILQDMSLALKAGALFRLRENKEAAYIFSKLFAANDIQKVSNYYGFNWSVVAEEDKKDYLALCKNHKEKSDMLGLFALQNPETNVEGLKEIYRLNPSSDMFSTLVVREINKYEELYLSPLLEKPGQNKNDFYYVFRDANADSVMKVENSNLQNFIGFLNNLSENKQMTDRGLMKVGAAYLSYMMQDYRKAEGYIEEAKKMNLSTRLQDQLMLTNILVTISKSPVIDAAFEEKLLPSLEWLAKKGSKPKWEDNNESAQWSRFYRNLLTMVLGKRYHAQNNLIKELMCISVADKFTEEHYDYENITLNALRHNFTGVQAEKLYDFLAAQKFTSYDKFLLTNGKIKINDVADFTGTAYLRDYDYDKAVTWLGKMKAQPLIKKNPFRELFFDREERLPGDKVTTSKMAYANEMKRLHELAKTDKANASKHLYKLALGYYNVTYYGYAWELVEYYRSGVDGYNIPENATGFQKEYYGAFTAHSYFEKALEASNDKEFKARCMFMMAKCAQKQVHRPQYQEYSYDWDKFEAAEKDYFKIFRNNKYFPDFKNQYGNTQFYKESLKRCSYLRDFVTGKKLKVSK
ncbi:MAG TPA: hypothetical protein PK110_06315 [Niabella sp.]|jgi:hypothetical protein|nr:hypothetical protein [Niabella sp.]